MNTSAPVPLVSERPPPPAEEKHVSTAEIDHSCRDPLLLLFVGAMIWVAVGLFFGLITSIKLHAPGFLANVGWLTFGRVRPAAMNAILYGFASQAGIGVLLWILCRLGGIQLLFQRTLLIAGSLWNLGVLLGVYGILAGGSTGFEWLEMPRYASPLLFVAYALIGICATIMFYVRRQGSLYVSQWYLLTALFWFPWIYSAANLLLIFLPVRGVVQAIVDAWFTSNFLGLWLTSIALGIVFYFLPKLRGRPLDNYYLAAFGFWTFLFFASWTGPAKLVGGPAPAWMVSVAIAANLLLVVPILCVAMNWHLTMRGLYAKVRTDVTLRFMVFAAASYLLSSLMGIVLSLREVSVLTHLTFVETAQVQVALLGFVSMALFGSLYYIIPRALGMIWPSAKLVQVHFWCSAIGLGLVFLAFFFGGIVQGVGLNNPNAPMINVVQSTIPFIGLSTLGILGLLAGQLALLWNLLLLLRAHCEPLYQSAMALVRNGAVAGGGSYE